MATISFGNGAWTGESFVPGQKHYWWTTMQFDDVVTVTPIASHFEGHESFIQVQDVKTEVDKFESKVVRFTIVNVGSTNIIGYQVHISRVSP